MLASPSRNFAVSVACLVLHALTLACRVETEPVDQGGACAFPPGIDVDENTVYSQGPLEYPAGGSLELLVGFAHCMSGSCDEFVDDYCNVSVEGTQIIIDAGGVVESKGRRCDSDCNTPTTKCRVDGLVAGTYELVMGENRGSIVLPSTSPQAHCTADTPW